MEEVLRLIRAVKRKLYCNAALKHLLDGVFWLATALSAAVLAGKLIFFPDAFVFLGWAALAGVVTVGVYVGFSARRSMFLAAVEADSGLGLAERMSSALLLCEDESPMAQAVVADARERALSTHHKGAFSVTLPEAWWRSAVAVGVLAGFLIMPQLDVFGRQAAFQRQEGEKEEVAKEVQDIRKKLKNLKETVGKEDAGLVELIESLEVKLAGIEKSEMGKKEALASVSKSLDDIAKKMEDLAKKLAEKGNKAACEMAKLAERKKLNDAAGKLADLKKALEQGSLSQEDAAKAAEALKKLAEETKGKLEETKKELAKLKEQLEKGDLSKEDAEKLAQALKQMQQMAALQEKLSQMLNQAASNMAGGNQTMSMAAMDQALGMLQSEMATSQASQQIQAMMDALKGMSQFKQNLTGSQPMSLAEALAQLEAARQMLAQGRGQGFGQGQGQGWGQGRGSGMGGAGTGEGNIWDVSDAKTQEQISAVKGDIRKGKVLASFAGQGGQIKNESKVEYEEIVLRSKRLAKEALSGQQIPRVYQSTVKSYFDSLMEQE